VDSDEGWLAAVPADRCRPGHTLRGW
jgi:hypothetical protein